MGRYHAYPEYKDSGLEWFGDIPSGWDVWKWKHTLASPMTYGANEAALDDDVKNPRYIRITDMNSDGSLRDDTFKSLQPEAAKNYLLKDGDILVARTGATVGKSFLYKNKFGAACFAGYLIRARINQNIVEPEFVYWYLQSDQYWKYISSSQIQATLQNVSAEKYGDMAIAIPPKKQDRLGIANFLDHETAKIDTLIEQQQQLIQLLKEKRQAVISHAVTKGLNPNAPMKDSGVEWLGEVPAHWVTCSLKHHASVIDCKHITAEFLDDGYPLASIGEVKGWFVNLATAKFTSEKFYFDLIGGGRKPVAGDIIYSRNATVGEAALVPVGLPEFAMGQDVCLIRLDCNLFPEYIMHILKSPVISRQLELAMVGSTFKRINVDDIRNFNIAMPPLDEQIKIVEHLETLLTKYDQIILGAQQSIDFMQERRTALISAAVTGKIDVRNWQAPQQ